MGLLNTKKTKEEALAKKLIENHKNLLKTNLKESGIKDLKDTLIKIGLEHRTNEMDKYMTYIVDKINYSLNKERDFNLESKLANKLYKAYITEGSSRFEKINGSEKMEGWKTTRKQTPQGEMIIESIKPRKQIIKKIRTKEELKETILKDLQDDYVYTLVCENNKFYQRSVTNGQYIVYNYEFELTEDEIEDIKQEAKKIKKCITINLKGTPTPITTDRDIRC